MIILDNIFDTDIVSKIITESFTNDYIIDWSHCSKDTVEDTGRFSTDLTNNRFLYKDLSLLLQRTLQTNFNVRRVYLNVMSYGSEGGYHFDSLDSNAYTILYFIGGPDDKTDTDEYGGYFYYKENGEIKCIEPLNNRLLFFKSDIIHKASCYKRMITRPRFSIAWKVYVNNL